MDTNWQNNPRLANMDKSKLEMLQNLAEQGSPYLKYCNVMLEQEKTADEDF